MTTISGSQGRPVLIDGLRYKIRKTEEFEVETFSLPEKQKFPTDHYEVKTFAVVGAIGSGKTTLTKRYYSYQAKQVWKKEIDFFTVRDLWATLEAVKNSRKLVHFLILDDSGSMFDSRKSMEKGRANVTEMYWEIRHEFKKAAKKGQGNKGGLVIIAIIIQDYMGLDVRIRNALGFTVFKTYDKAADKMIPDKKIIQLLKKIKDKSVRVCDWTYRKYAVGVDAEENYTLFYADVDQLPVIPFTHITGEDIFERQRSYFINYLIDHFQLEEESKDDLKAELHFEKDRYERKLKEYCRINRADFSEIIIMAKRIQKIRLEPLRLEKLKELAKQKQEQQKKKKELSLKQYNRIKDHLINSFTLSELTKDDIKAEILFEVERIEVSAEFLVDRALFPEIILKANRIQKLQKIAIEEEKRKSETNENEPNERTNMSELILHGIFKKTFREIKELKGISVSTAHDRYSKQKRLQENCLKVLEANELELVEESINLNS